MGQLEEPKLRGAEILDAIDADQRARLESGVTVTVLMPPSGGKGVAARALALVEAPVHKVWPVVRDPEHFSKFIPRTKKSEVRQRDEDSAVCFVEVAMPFPLKNLWSEVRSVCATLPDDKGFERRWTLLKGSYDKNSGAWSVLRWADKRSLLVYEIDVAPKIKIPDVILRKAQTGALPDVLQAVRDRVRRLG